MTSTDLLIGIFSISGCFWITFGLYTSIRTMLFIVKRYEQETDLGRSKYFKEWMPWAKYLPSFSKSALYAAHLSTFCSNRKNSNADKILKKIRKNKIYEDIESPEQVTRHFSKKEIRRVKRLMKCAVIVGIHAIAYFIFRFIWPETFS